MIIQIEFKTQEDKKNILEKYNDWFLLEEMYLLDRNYLFLSELSKDPSLDEIVREQGDKISILEAENADLLLDSAIKDSKISTLENDLADLTLEIAMMEVR